MSRHTLSVLVENKPGVLARIAGLFSRRGFNIHSLAVGPTEHVEVSRRLDERLCRLGVGYVGLDSTAADLGRDGLRLLAPGAVADDHLGACTAELERDRAPDTP